MAWLCCCHRWISSTGDSYLLRRLWKMRIIRAMPKIEYLCSSRNQMGFTKLVGTSFLRKKGRPVYFTNIFHPLALFTPLLQEDFLVFAIIHALFWAKTKWRDLTLSLWPSDSDFYRFWWKSLASDWLKIIGAWLIIVSKTAPYIPIRFLSVESARAVICGKVVALCRKNVETLENPWVPRIRIYLHWVFAYFLPSTMYWLPFLNVSGLWFRQVSHSPLYPKFTEGTTFFFDRSLNFFSKMLNSARMLLWKETPSRQKSVFFLCKKVHWSFHVDKRWRSVFIYFLEVTFFL